MSRWSIIAAAFLAAFLVASWLGVENIAGKGYLESASKTRSLQVELARTAMETSFLQRITELFVLSNYTFPEYLTGARTKPSIQSLLNLELKTYPDILCYALFNAPGQRDLVAQRAEATEIQGAMDRASEEFWPMLAAFEGPLVRPMNSPILGPYFMVFVPVRIKAERKALLGVAIGLQNAIVKYLLPLQPDAGRKIFLLASGHGVLWPVG